MPDTPQAAPKHTAADPGQVVEFPGTPERAGTRDNNLPLQLTDLVGREREIKEVENLLSEHRLITLTGPGGSGKTRLALAAASGRVGDYENGTWLIELAPLSEPELVPQAVASVLGVREAPGRSLTETLANHLGSREMLLVLDNCEHLVDASASLAEALLSRCPNLKVLTTSREALGVEGETLFVVPPLSLPDPRHLPAPDGLSDYEAARLFVERAKAVRTGFEITEQNAVAVAQICHRLDGMPLAIELAAARTKALSAKQIAARLEDSFALLAGSGRRTAPTRQWTLRATMDWSHDLLSERERVLFRRLSVFSGGFSLEAAEGVCAGEGLEGDEALEVLSSLVDKSLVLVEERDGEARYQLLETVRQYGREKLVETGEAEAVRERHARHYLAEVTEPSSGDQEAWLGRLQTEHDNLRAALSFSLGREGGRTEGDALLGLRLVVALWPFWYTRGYLSEGRGWLERSVSRGVPAAASLEAAALNGSGYIALFQGEYGAAKGFLERSLALYRTLEDKEGIASSLIYLGFVAVLGQRDLETIPALYEEAASLGPEIKDRRVTGNLLIFSALMAINQGDFERAAVLSGEGLVLFREIQDVQGMGHSLNNLGLGAVMQHDYDDASAFLRENLRVARKADYKLAIQYSLFGLGLVAAALGQAVRAARLWGAEEAMAEASGIRITPLARSSTGYDGHVAAARSRLGKEAAFDTAWSEGRAMTLEEAVEYALGTEDLASPPEDASPSLLSERETEVLRLVAEGLTDPQVARRLYLSPRTVGQHLRSIYRKLGVPSRAAAAREALERGLI